MKLPLPGRHGVLATLLGYELRMLARDRRTMFIAVVAPLMIFPLLIFAMRWAEGRQAARLEATTFRYAVTGRDADWARATVRRALARPPADTLQAPATFEEVPLPDPEGALQAGALHLVVEALATGGGGGDTATAGPAEPGREPGAAGDGTVQPGLRLAYRGNSEASARALGRLRARLLDLRAEKRATAFRERGFPVDPREVVAVEDDNVASAEREGGALLGTFLTPLLVMLMLSGGSIVAADTLAGEKERGTLETLLTTAAGRLEIVWAKQLAVIAVGTLITVINLLNLLVYVVLGVFDLPPGIAVDLAPSALGVLLVLFLPMTLLISSVLLLLSGLAGSYKEYQIYFFPVFLLFLIPSTAAVLPGLDLRSVVALVPVAGVSVAAREVLTGEVDLPFLALTFGVTAGVAAWLAGVTARALSTERLVTAAELDRADLVGGAALFPRHVLRWFALGWVILLVTSLWFGDGLGLRGQVILNLLGLFAGGTALMVWRYRLPVRDALALRAPPPAAWVAVLVGAPSAYLTGILVARLTGLFLPVPERMIEAFGEYLLAEDLPLWQLLVFLCVLPGVCEEVAFRGVLLHGLRKRLGPVGLALAVGGIFGLFHVSLFRILPTAYLGVVLAAVVLLTGSIYPAMVWHALNNAVALVPAWLGWVSEEAGYPPWVYAAGVAGLVVAGWILWRYRRPYLRAPSLRAR